MIALVVKQYKRESIVLGILMIVLILAGIMLPAVTFLKMIDQPGSVL
jgi:hypothetical protein